MFNSFNPQDHYWKAEDGRAYSSASMQMVAADDAEFQAWVASGRLPTVWPRDDAGQQTDAALLEVLAPYGLGLSGKPGIPTSISRAQAKIQLRRAGLRDKVEAEIAKADPEVQDWYAEAGTWQRTNTHVAALAKVLKLTPAQVDDLFLSASQIEA